MDFAHLVRGSGLISPPIRFGVQDKRIRESGTNTGQLLLVDEHMDCYTGASLG